MGKRIELVAYDGDLCYPADISRMLCPEVKYMPMVHRYKEGDCDTITWPNPNLDHLHEELFGAIECGWIGSEDRIFLPDGCEYDLHTDSIIDPNPGIIQSHKNYKTESGDVIVTGRMINKVFGLDDPQRCEQCCDVNYEWQTEPLKLLGAIPIDNKIMGPNGVTEIIIWYCGRCRQPLAMETDQKIFNMMAKEII